MTSSESQDTRLISATPVLASLDIERSVGFFCTHLGFSRLYAQQGACGVVMRDAVSVHFWSCSDRHIAQNTSCRVRVEGIEALFLHCHSLGIVHPDSQLENKPWGSREFSILDPDGNLVTFSQHLEG
jgi:catechol 2,3-dioxygenase-like lactoylglutathione lyase family enzyme